MSQLSSDKSNNWLFGYNTGSNNPNAPKMYSAYGALHFGGNQTEQYVGTTTVRGMLVDQWQSCLYWPNMDATMTVNWYFTGKMTDCRNSALAAQLKDHVLSQATVICVRFSPVWRVGESYVDSGPWLNTMRTWLLSINSMC